MKDYKKSAKPGRPKCPPGKMVGKYAEGGMAENQRSGQLQAALQQFRSGGPRRGLQGLGSVLSMFGPMGGMGKFGAGMRQQQPRNAFGVMGRFMNTMRKPK